MSDIASRIKTVASGRWDEIYSRLCGVNDELLDGDEHPCPACGGKDRFRFSNMDRDGSIFCNQCDLKAGDGISGVMMLKGWNFMEAAAELKKFLGIHGSQGNGRAVKVKTKAANQQALMMLWTRRQKGIELDALIRNDAEIKELTDQGKRRQVIAIPVHDGVKKTGELYYPLDDKPLHSKTGAEMSRKLQYGTKPGWFGTDGLRRILSGTAKVVFKVEGATDMLALDSVLTSAKHAVISQNAGAKQVLPRECLEQLRGKTVVVVADNDPAGIKGARKWCRELSKYAEKVILVIPPGEGQDIRDWLETVEFDKQAFFELVKECKEFKLEKSAEHPEGGPEEVSEPVLLAPEEPEQLARDFCRVNTLIHWKRRWYLRRVTGQWVEMSTDSMKSMVFRFVNIRLEQIYQDESAAKLNQSGIEVNRKKSYIQLRNETYEQSKALCAASDDLDINCLLETQSFENTELIGSVGERKNWLAMENGIFMLDAFVKNKSEILITPRRDWFSTIYLNFKFSPTAGRAEAEPFYKFLEEQVANEQAIGMLQEFAGYMLTSDLQLQKFLMMHGEGGTGKSTMAGILRALCGINGASAVTLTDFHENTYRLNSTFGKMANISGETGDMDKVCEEILKTYTAGEPVSFEGKFKDPIDACPTAKLILCSNRQPKFKDRSEGVWRRMLYVRFDNVITEEKDVKGMTYPEFWHKRGMIPSIFNWALGGLARVCERGRITESSESEKSKAEYKWESRPEEGFFTECVNAVPGSQTTTAEMQRRYKEWCSEMGFKLEVSATVLGQHIKRAFRGKFERRLAHRGGRRQYVYFGLSLARPDPLAQNESDQSQP